MQPLIGIYEKALPKNLFWEQRFRAVKEAGYDFLEISIDESNNRMSRLDWNTDDRTGFLRASREEGVLVPSVCLSAHRKAPFGSADPALRKQAMQIMTKAIDFASDCGIRVIQMAGYDVYYEKSTEDSKARYLEGMAKALELAARYQVTLAIEIMDTTFMNSITKFLRLKEQLPSPWLLVYPDLGNLSAWGNDITHEFAQGINHIAGIHVKESKAVAPNFAGAFRDIPFGEGSVDFVHAFSTLKKLNYAGPFLVEMWTENAADPLAEMTRARAWVGEKMRQGGYQ